MQTEAPLIVLAEDDADLQLLVELALQKVGYRLLLASDGPRALELVFEWRPNLVILDVSLPGLDGLSVVDALRADPRTNRLPIILLSASVMEEQIQEGLRRGATAYLKKPFAIRELLTVTASLTNFQTHATAGPVRPSD